MQFGGSGRSCIGGLMPDLQPKAAVRPYWGTALELEALIPLIRSKLSNTAGGGTSGDGGWGGGGIEPFAGSHHRGM